MFFAHRCNLESTFLLNIGISLHCLFFRRDGLRVLGMFFSFSLLIFAPKYRLKLKLVHTLLNFLSASAELAFWLTCRSTMNGLRVVEPVAMLEKMVKAQLKVEHSYFLLIDSEEIFINKWVLGVA